MFHGEPALTNEWFHVKCPRRTGPICFFGFWLEESKVLVILVTKKNKYNILGDFLTFFLDFSNKSQMLFKLQKRDFKTMFYYFFYQLKDAIFWIKGQIYSINSYFRVLNKKKNCPIYFVIFCIFCIFLKLF